MTNEQTDFRALCAELTDRLQHAITSANADSYYGENRDAVDRARAALAQPEPEGPSDEDLIQLAIDTRLYRFQATAGDPIQYEMTEQQIHAFARAALARWGRPAINPVPVAERLPGPEDCDAEGRCWWLTLAVADGGRGGYSTFWELTTFKAAVRCASHWLPHHALPLPQQSPDSPYIFDTSVKEQSPPIRRP